MKEDVVQTSSSSSQPGSLQNPLGLLFVQCLVSLSILYRPESILAATTAFPTSYGLPAQVQMGWGEERDMNAGLKWGREGRRSASPLSFTCHQSITLDLHKVFHLALDCGDWRMRRGSDRKYCWHSVLTLRNQDVQFLSAVAESRMCLP